MSNWNLGALADPNAYHDPININGQHTADLLNLFETMQRIRLIEMRLADARRDGLIGGPVHLGVGQEAVAVGVASRLRKTDRVFGGHRSHSHIVSLGADTRSLFAEVLGKDTGLSRGMGGSMHLWDQPNGFFGAVPIVSGTVPLAVGAAIASKFQNQGNIGVAYLGDGAIEEGVVHESLNLAKVTNAPVLFVVENNLFASHMHISLRQPEESTARFAEANSIPFETVEGNNIVAVQEMAAKLIDRIRSGKGPGFLEAITFRWYGHVDWRDDIDVGVNRSQSDIAQWRKRDPIARLKTSLANEGKESAAELQRIERRLVDEINEAWEQAMDDPYPEISSLHTRVYAKPVSVI